MARSPSAGKSRLADRLDPARLTALRAALLADTIAVARASKLPMYLFAAPEGDANELHALAGGIPIRIQFGANLGRRMANVVAELLTAGHDAAILVGTDIPPLKARDISEAASLVADDVLVIGPADDGGYYLIATARDEPSLFEGMEWGTGHVTRDTIIRAEQAGLDVALLRRLRDLDTPEDLEVVQAVLAAADADLAPALRRWLEEGKAER